MQKLNIIQFNYHQKLRFRRELLKKAQRRLAQKLMVQSTSTPANDNILTTIDIRKDQIKL